MSFLTKNNFLFKAERVKKSQIKKNSSRIKIFIKDQSTLENLAYFDSRKDYSPKIKSTLRNLDSRPLLYILKPKAIQKRLQIWFFSLDAYSEAGKGLGKDSTFFIGELLREGKIPVNTFSFTNNNGEILFLIKPNLTGTNFQFKTVKSEESYILAEGIRKMTTMWGWDWEFSLNINPECNKFTRALLICSMRVIAPIFYPS